MNKNVYVYIFQFFDIHVPNKAFEKYWSEEHYE